MRKNNTEFQKKKNVIMFLYDYGCVMCGLVSINNHVHHIDQNSGNNDSFNLVPVCRECHRQLHMLNLEIRVSRSSMLLAVLKKLDSFF